MNIVARPFCASPHIRLLVMVAVAAVCLCSFSALSEAFAPYLLESAIITCDSEMTLAETALAPDGNGGRVVPRLGEKFPNSLFIIEFFHPPRTLS